MTLLRKFNALFIHIPKCGGEAISAAFELGEKLEDLRWQIDPENGIYLHHFTITELLDGGYLAGYEHFFRFAVVRNPWARFVSAYFFMKDWEAQHIRGKSFEEYLLQTVRIFDETGPNSLICFIRPQWLFVCHQGQRAVNMVGKVEAMQDSLDLICDQIGAARRKIPRHNASKHDAFPSYYTRDTAKLIERVYRKDCEMFGYSIRSVLG